MRWRRNRGSATATAPSPVVVAVTSALTRATARELATQLERLDPAAEVVIDLTGIAGFDTDGAADLLQLQENLPPHRVSIVGLRQATARLLGDVDPGPEPALPRESGWVVRHLRNLVVVQVANGDRPSTDDLEPALSAAAASSAAIIVVDLRDTGALTPAGLQAITFASSAAALRGQELLVVNVAPAAAEALRTAGLSATTYVAPEPPLGSL